MRHSILRLIPVISLLLSLNLHAEDFYLDGVYYSTNEQTAIVTNADCSGDVIIPATVTYENKTYTVTEIEENIFRNQESLTSVIIKAQITKLPSFTECHNLKSVTLPPSVNELAAYTFNNCTSLQSVTGFGNLTITEIPEYLFYYCTSLESIDFPSSLQKIGELAFYGCSSLASVSFPSSLKEIDGGAFDNCSSLTELYLPASLKSYGSFSYCTSLSKVTIGAIEPEEGISLGIFDGCSALNSLYIEDSDSELVCSAVPYYCPLQEVYIGRPTKGLGFDCTETLTKASIGDKVNDIQDGLFRGCYNLSTITMPMSISSIGEYAFQDCRSLTNFTIPSGCNTIKSGAFSGCTGLTSISIPDIEIINNCTFYGCTGLTSIEIPNSIKVIGNEAFYGCKKLQTLTFSDGVESIGDGAFYENTKLTDLYYHGNLESWLKIQFKTENYPEDTNPLSYADNLYLNALDTGEGYLLSDLIIPASIDSIQAFAFSGYSGLKSIKTEGTLKTIGESAFSSCRKLTNAEIDVIDIQAEAFLGCGLTNLTLSKNLKSIGSSAFYTYKSTDVTYTGTLYDWCHINFKNEYCLLKNTLTIDGEQIVNMTLPTGISTINPNTFSHTNSLISLTIPSTVKKIENNAFNSCANLEEVTVKGELTKIGNYAFAYDYKLKIFRKAASAETSSIKALSTSAETTEIGIGAFQSDELLATIDMPVSIGKVGEYAFDGTAWLNNQPDGIIYIGNTAYIYKGEMPENSTIEIKNGTTDICSGAFSNRSNLIAITFPQSLENIGNAFSGSGLKSLIIPQHVKRIGANIVSNCINLTDFKISDGDEPLLVEVPAIDNYSLCPNSTENLYIGRLFAIDSDKLKETQSSTLAYIAELMKPGYPDLSEEELIDKIISIWVSIRLISYNEGANIKSLTFGKNITDIPSEINFIDATSSSINEITCMSNTPPALYFTDPDYMGGYYYQDWFNKEYGGKLAECTLYIPTGTADAYAAADFWKEFLTVTTKEFSGIESTIDDTEAVETARYDISGNLLSAPVKGINIIRLSNGKVKKVFIR